MALKPSFRRSDRLDAALVACCLADSQPGPNLIPRFGIQTRDKPRLVLAMSADDSNWNTHVDLCCRLCQIRGQITRAVFIAIQKNQDRVAFLILPCILQETPEVLQERGLPSSVYGFLDANVVSAVSFTENSSEKERYCLDFTAPLHDRHDYGITRHCATGALISNPSMLCSSPRVNRRFLTALACLFETSPTFVSPSTNSTARMHPMGKRSIRSGL